MIVRANQRQLNLFQATKLGELSSSVVGKLKEFAKTVKTLTVSERQLVLSALGKLKGQ
jgi:hypothetical protein